MDRSHQLSQGETCPVHQTAYQEAQSRVHATGTNLLSESDARHNRSQSDSIRLELALLSRVQATFRRVAILAKLKTTHLQRRGEERKRFRLELFESFLFDFESSS